MDAASYPEGLVLAFHSTLNRALKLTGKGHIRIERREESSRVRRVRCICARTPWHPQILVYNKQNRVA